MTFINWLSVGGYLLVCLLIGLYFVRRASRSMEDYFVAGRSLPWWIIGFANCATYTGGSAAWVMLVYQSGLTGNFWWWPTWVVWMPLVAILWARYWSRMGIVTTAEFIELRYSGKMAKIYRVIYAFYNGCGWAPLITGYITGWMVAEFQPILGWSRFEIVLGCGIVVLVYTSASGLFGVAYSQVFQLVFYLVGASLLIPYLIGHFGGWHQTVAAAVASRGQGFMKALPPSHTITPLILLALFVQGFFFAANPTAGEGSTAQRFMAAKNESHAALGQILSTVLALIVRVVPFVIYGVAAAALIPPNTVAPALIWSHLVVSFAPKDLVGVLVAAELAGYMAMANASMNWGGSFLTNDIYKRTLRPAATDRELARVGKISSIMITVLSFLVAFFLVNRMMSWFLYINAVMIAFILPLAWLRFFWWRLNIWGEAAGVLLGLPLGYIIWFPMGFSQRPLWEGFFTLFFAGWAAIIFATLVTKPESIETLQRFYMRCKPPGLWKPVEQTCPPEIGKTIRQEFRRDLLNGAMGILTFGLLIVAFNSVFAGDYLLTLASALLTIVCAVIFVRRWRLSWSTSRSSVGPS